jgi:hypothetical protein
MILSAAEGASADGVVDNGCGLGLYLQLAAQAGEHGLELTVSGPAPPNASLAVVSAEGNSCPSHRGSSTWCSRTKCLST